MSRPLKVVALSGCTWRPPRTLTLTLPIGVYASQARFANDQITSEPLKARIRRAAERTAPLFGVPPKNLRKIA